MGSRTLLDMAQWQEVTRELSATLPWHTRRANLLLAGIEFTEAVGQ